MPSAITYWGVVLPVEPLPVEPLLLPVEPLPLDEPFFLLDFLLLLLLPLVSELDDEPLPDCPEAPAPEPEPAPVEL
ncbi:MAG: hypothetical protein JWN34_5609 [Bryobacterales bacterium]|nr:hypothetical protein [Bryobacterales bacterium]